MSRVPNNRQPVIRPQRPSYAGARGMTIAERFDHIQSFQKVPPVIGKPNGTTTPVPAAPTSSPTAPGGGRSGPALSDVAGTDVVTAAVGASAGTALDASRSDHTHDLPNLAGDVTGAYNVTVVGKIRGHVVKNATPTDGQIFVWVNANSDWEPLSVSGDATLSNTGAVTVGKIQGHAVKNATPTDGQIFVWVNANSDWEPLSVSGDATLSNAGAVTLATVGAAATKGSASKTVTATVNAKGLVTSLTDQDIAIAATQVTSGTLADARLSFKRCVEWIGPTTLVTGGDTVEVTLPADFSSRVLSRVQVRVQTTSSSGSFQLALELSTASGAFSVAQTSDTFTITAGSYETIVTSFTNGLTGSSGNKVRFNISSLGTGTANLTIETEWL